MELRRRPRAGATRSSRQTIKDYLNAGRTTLDADGNGSADALSDGILILRYLFDPTGAWNVSDALGSGATRTTRQDIKAYLDLYNPGLSRPADDQVTAGDATATLQAIAASISCEKADAMPRNDGPDVLHGDETPPRDQGVKIVESPVGNAVAVEADRPVDLRRPGQGRGRVARHGPTRLVLAHGGRPRRSARAARYGD